MQQKTRIISGGNKNQKFQSAKEKLNQNFMNHQASVNSSITHEMCKGGLIIYTYFNPGRPKPPGRDPSENRAANVGKT